jgi:hypothetical protein
MMSDYLSQAIDKAKKKNKNWPGLPLTQLPLVAQPQLQAALAAGEVKIVSQVGVMGGTNDYIVKVK